MGVVIRFYSSSSSIFFSKYVFWEKSQAPELRNLPEQLRCTSTTVGSSIRDLSLSCLQITDFGGNKTAALANYPTAHAYDEIRAIMG